MGSLIAGFVPLALLAAATVWLSWVDVATRRIPTPALALLSGMLLSWCVWNAWAASDPSALVRALLVAALFFSIALVAALVHPPGLGGGDVKLAALIGGVLGWHGWLAVFLGVLLIVMTVGSAAVITVSIQRRSTKTRTLPLAPLVFLATWVTLLSLGAIPAGVPIQPP